MASDVRFIAPEDTSITTAFNLMKDDNNYIIRVAFKFEQKKMYISTKKDGVWGTAVGVDIDFKPGDDIEIRFEAREEYWLVYLNGKEVNQFKHIYPVTDIIKAKFFPHDGVKVISYSVHF